MKPDFTTKYLGKVLRSPLMVASSPLASEIDVLRRVEELGVGAAVLPSLFEEQLDPAAQQSAPWEEFQGASPSHHRELLQYNRGPETYLRYLERARRAVSIPLFASINSTSLGGWLDWARRIEEAGADGLELNMMILAVDPLVTAAEVEQRYVDIVQAVRGAVKLPLAAKIGSQFSALPNLVSRLVEAGADGVVLFNRYLQPEINLSKKRITSHLTFSVPSEAAQTLRWLGILYGRVSTSFAASGGVASGMDLLNAIAVGADVVQVASVLYRRGIAVLSELHEDAERWLGEHEYPSTDALRGTLSQLHCADPAAYARANYTRAISSFVTDTV